MSLHWAFLGQFLESHRCGVNDVGPRLASLGIHWPRVPGCGWGSVIELAWTRFSLAQQCSDLTQRSISQPFSIEALQVLPLQLNPPCLERRLEIGGPMTSQMPATPLVLEPTSAAQSPADSPGQRLSVYSSATGLPCCTRCGLVPPCLDSVVKSPG
jgi:hypothetical protein